MAENEEITTSKKVNAFLEKNTGALICAVIILACLLIGFVIGSVVKSSSNAKNLDAVETIAYTMTNGSASLEDAEIEARRAEALDALQAYTKKSGAAGVRANMIAAEITYQQEKYEDAINYWNAVVSKGKKAYTAPIAYYNLASCYEELNKLDDAAANYKNAAEANDFVLQNHAKFSYGRVLETQGKYAEAVTVYTELNGKYPNDKWAQLAKTRIIALQVEGKAE